MSILATDGLTEYSFFQLVELLSEAEHFDPEKMETCQFDASLFYFKTHSGLGFPVSEIAGIEAIKIKTAGKIFREKYNIAVNFLGLQGASSPLPGFIIEEIAYESAQDIGIKHMFFDFFNHRLNVFLHKIWRKYRYYAQFKENAADIFSRKVFSFIGLDDEEFKVKASIDPSASGREEGTLVNWGRLLNYCGLIASRSRSPLMVTNIITHYFDLKDKDVEILEWQKRSVDMPSWQLNDLGQRNCQLDNDFIIGSSVVTYSNKFVICLNNLKTDIFHAFLPTGNLYKVICTLVSFLLRDQISFDLRLGLIQEEIPLMELKKDNKIFLGWNTFIGENSLLRQSMVTIKGQV